MLCGVIAGITIDESTCKHLPGPLGWTFGFRHMCVRLKKAVHGLSGDVMCASLELCKRN
jgi:hypothetical protein